MATIAHPERIDNFLMDILQWRDVASFAAHLAQYAPASTPPFGPAARGVTYHHSVSPTPATWRGVSTMLGMARYYRDTRGWDRGPSLYMVSGSPDPNQDGIWQMTPLNEPGIHAGACNASMYGLEVVGSYDTRPWPADIAALALGAGQALLAWLGAAIGPATVKGHKDCLNNKSCPGNAIDMAAVRRGLAALPPPCLLASPSIPRRYDADSLVMSPATGTRIDVCHAFAQRCTPSKLSYDTLGQIAGCIWDHATAGGVDPWLAAAQCCYETGNMTSPRSQPPLYQTAGIGVVADGAAGVGFADYDAATQAQIGRLLLYALAPSVLRTPEQARLMAFALQARPLSSTCWGSAPTLRALGSGPNPVAGCGWAGNGEASGLEYGARVAEVANALKRLAS